MMSIDLSDQTPLPPRLRGKSPRRAAPCAGLFGWRKDTPEARSASRDRHAPWRDGPLD